MLVLIQVLPGWLASMLDLSWNFPGDVRLLPGNSLKQVDWPVVLTGALPHTPPLRIRAYSQVCCAFSFQSIAKEDQNFILSIGLDA